MSPTYEPATYRMPAVSADPTEIRAWSAGRPVADPPADPRYRDYAELPPDPCVPDTASSSAGKAAFLGAAVVLYAFGAQALLGFVLYEDSAASPPGPAVVVPADAGPGPVSSWSLPDSGPGRADAGPRPDNGGGPTDAGTPHRAAAGMVISIPVMPPLIQQPAPQSTP